MAGSASSLCIFSVISGVIALASGITVIVSKHTCDYGHSIGSDPLVFEYNGLRLPAKCTFKIIRSSGDLLCVKRVLYFHGCKTTVGIYRDLYIKYPNKMLNCYTIPEEDYCVPSTTVFLEFKNAPDVPKDVNIQVQVYIKQNPTVRPFTPISPVEKAPESDSNVGVIVIIVAVAIAVLLFVLVFVCAIVIVRRRRRLQETSGGVIFNTDTQQSSVTGQSTTATADTGPHTQPLLPGSTGYKPPAGYHPPSQFCYPPPVEQGRNQPGYTPPTVITYPGNTGTGHQTGTQGNQPPISQNTQPAPSAPPEEAINDDDDDPPPPYPGY